MTPQEVHLRLRLDALGGHGHAERLRHRDDRRDDRSAAVIGFDFREEAAVDLQVIDREFAQVAQRRVAGAKVIERDGDVEAAKFFEHAYRTVTAGHQRRLRDFDVEILGLDAAVSQ